MQPRGSSQRKTVAFRSVLIRESAVLWELHTKRAGHLSARYIDILSTTPRRGGSALKLLQHGPLCHLHDAWWNRDQRRRRATARGLAG